MTTPTNPQPEKQSTPRTDAEMPGAWICDKCKFILQKNVLYTGSGNIAADTSPLNERCPNDGMLMRPFTWREANEGFAEDNQRLRQELNAAKAEIERLKQYQLLCDNLEAEGRPHGSDWQHNPCECDHCAMWDKFVKQLREIDSK